ncbi:TPA: hypothetical protein ACGO1T_001867 [Streptococcus suis]
MQTVNNSQEIMNTLKSLNYIDYLKEVSDDFEESIEQLLHSKVEDIEDFLLELKAWNEEK